MYYNNCAVARAGTVTRTPQNVRTVRTAHQNRVCGCSLSQAPSCGQKSHTTHQSTHLNAGGLGTSWTINVAEAVAESNSDSAKHV